MTRKPPKTRTPQVHTLASLKARCADEGPCLIWPGIGPTGKKVDRPMIFHAGTRLPVRRLFAILRGDPRALAEEAGQIAKGYWAVTCGDPHCMAEAHTLRRTPDEHLQAARTRANSGTSNAVRVAKITRTRRARSGKLTPEQIRQIAASSDSVTTEARRHNVSRALISRMRLRDVSTQAGSIFSGLGARP